MGGKTKAELWREEMDAKARAHFERALGGGGLPDPRRAQGTRYPLATVVTTALMARVCGADDAQAMETWGGLNEAWLATFLEMPHGSPTRDVFLLLSVKDNQPTLRRDIVARFDDAAARGPCPLDPPAPLAVERWQQTEKGHGRIEEREAWVCRDLSRLTTAEQWDGPSFIAMARSTRTNVSTSAQTHGARYFIGSDPDVSVEQIASLIRRHWAIENSLHWTLDVALHEDSARHRAGGCAYNRAVLRHLALDLLKSEKTHTLGVANKRKTAAWDRNDLLRVLAGLRA